MAFFPRQELLSLLPCIWNFGEGAGRNVPPPQACQHPHLLLPLLVHFQSLSGGGDCAPVLLAQEPAVASHEAGREATCKHWSCALPTPEGYLLSFMPMF